MPIILNILLHNIKFLHDLYVDNFSDSEDVFLRARKSLKNKTVIENLSFFTCN